MYLQSRYHLPRVPPSGFSALVGRMSPLNERIKHHPDYVPPSQLIMKPVTLDL